MQFQELLDLFETYHRNEDTEWIASSGVLAKQALNFGLKETYNRWRNTETGKRMLSAKTATIVVTAGEVNLPADFAELRQISWSLRSTESPTHQIIYDLEQPKILIDNGSYTIRYIPQPKKLVNTTDIVGLPEELLFSICDFWMDFYYMWERNWVERSNNMTFAQKNFEIRSGQIWDNTEGEHFSS